MSRDKWEELREFLREGPGYASASDAIEDVIELLAERDALEARYTESLEALAQAYREYDALEKALEADVRDREDLALRLGAERDEARAELERLKRPCTECKRPGPHHKLDCSEGSVRCSRTQDGEGA